MEKSEMKTCMTTVRLEPSVKKYLAAAAKRDRRSLSQFLVKAALDRAAELMEKAPPIPRDGRQKAALPRKTGGSTTCGN